MFSNFCFATFADHKIIGVCNHSIVTLYKRIIMTSFDVDDPRETSDSDTAFEALQKRETQSRMLEKEE
jgi:hypothetical protein